MNLVVLEKIESSILNDLGYIVHLEKKNGSSPTLVGDLCFASVIFEMK